MTPPKASVPRPHCRCCGKEFYARPCTIRRGWGLFCSHKCQFTTHNKGNSRAYASWESMIQRCTNPKNPRFSKYGGAGVTISKEWRESFELFFADMGDRPIGKSLDRINGKLGYCKENCRWATPQEQSQNTKTNHLLTFRGETKCLVEWSRTVGLSTSTITSRLQRGWSVEETLDIPRTHRSHIEAVRKKYALEISMKILS